MKLWQKTSLICIAVLLTVVAVCSVILLVYSKNTILELTYSEAETKQANLASSFTEMADYYVTDKDSQTVKNSLVSYCFSRFADPSSVLIRGEETVYSGVSIYPPDYLTLSDSEQRRYTGEIDGRNILITGSSATVAGSEYFIYVVEDISTVYNSISSITWTFVIVSAAAILAGACIIVLLMRKSTKPLTALAGTAREIAGGAYEKRAEVKTLDEIGALAGDFNLMAGAVETRINELTETAERQQLFIGGVTHEFKTPLTTLLLHAGLLRRANMTDEEKDASLEHIENQCAWLERMVQQLLRLITLEQSIEKKETSVSELFCRVRECTAKTLADRGVCLVTEDNAVSLPMNIDLMQSLLINLVDNAAKAYDAEAADRTVTLKARDNAIEVIDHGRGIPQEALKRIFEPFYMVDKSRSKKQGGSGIGLALVRAIADAHNATLEVESTVGIGTAVRVSFPIITK